MKNNKPLFIAEDFKFVVKDKVDELYEILRKAENTEVEGRGFYFSIVEGYVNHLDESINKLKRECESRKDIIVQSDDGKIIVRVKRGDKE